MPIELSLFSAEWGRDSLTGFVRADSADLSLIQAFVGKEAVNSVSGRLAANVRVRGTPQAKTFDGNVVVTNGSAFLLAGLTFALFRIDSRKIGHIY